MSSSDIRPPGQYPAYWHDCLAWLATRKAGDWISLADGLTKEQVNTQHTRARSMKRSIETYSTWPLNIRTMVQDDLLGFRREFNGFSYSLIAYHKHLMHPSTEIAKNIRAAIDNSS